MSGTSTTSTPTIAPADLQGQRVLLTGATGLVGARVLRALLGARARVHAVVRGGSTLEGAERIVVPSYAPASLRDALAGFAADLVIHLGAYGVKPAERDALAMVEGNVGVTAALLEALAPSPPRRFLFAGSSAQYRADCAPALLDEGALQAPASVYGACKCAAEVVGQSLARQHAIPFVSLRLFGVYGPGEAPHRMVPHLARALAAGELPELTPGAQVRDWVYVDDAAEAILAAAIAPLTHAAYNVCSGTGVAVRDVARSVGSVLGKDDAALGLGRRAYRADEPMWIVGDPARFRAATGWQARTALDEGVRRTVAWALASTPAERR